MKRIKLLLKFVALLYTISSFGCATVMHGTPQDIPVNMAPTLTEKTLAPEQGAPQPNGNTVIVARTFATVRSGSGNSYPVVATVKHGDRLVLIGEYMDWVNVRLENDQEGWISNSVVKSGSMGFGLQESAAREEFEFNGGLLYLDVAFESEYLEGDTTYHITFPGGESELEFPLRTFLIGPKIGWGYKNQQDQDKFQLNIEWLTNIGHGSGKIKDSDWMGGDGHPGLDVYSESDIKLRANIVNVNAIYNFWPIKNLAIGPMVGYVFQQFKYDVSNLNQVGYGPHAPIATGYTPGKVGDYKVTYHIPYFGLNSDLLFGNKFQAKMELGYTPWALAKDRDDHILRYKLSKGDTDGYAYLANLNANWNFLPDLFLTIGGEYMRIHTTGTQNQSFYAGPFVGWTGDVDDKITSSQWFLSVVVTYRFSAKQSSILE